MTALAAHDSGRDVFSHDLLLHDSDLALVQGTRAFVQEGLGSGGQVLVHSTESQVALLRKALGSHPRLTYGLDQDLYQSPMATLFHYQRVLEDSSGSTALWATGTVPLGEQRAGQDAWARYESLVNEVLGPYAFHGLCTYDTQALPAHVIAAAKATHPHVDTDGGRRPSPDYQHPAGFLTTPLAGSPRPPSAAPTLVMNLLGAHDLVGGRRHLRHVLESSAVPGVAVGDLVTATNEVLTNGLRHGAPPVRLELWVQPSRVTCRVTDRGPGIGDPLSGYRYAEPSGPTGLWTARHLCGEVLVSNPPGGGCSVVLTSP
jgi:anti-sigma regulatory factor (Ser/Thr protein kinase)